MKSKWHLIVSNIKSAVRIVTCLAVIIYGIISGTPALPLSILAIGLCVAELLGILEELGDKRG